jgi:hypothetical protein
LAAGSETHPRNEALHGPRSTKRCCFIVIILAEIARTLDKLARSAVAEGQVQLERVRFFLQSHVNFVMGADSSQQGKHTSLVRQQCVTFGNGSGQCRVRAANTKRKGQTWENTAASGSGLKVYS